MLSVIVSGETGHFQKPSYFQDLIFGMRNFLLIVGIKDGVWACGGMSISMLKGNESSQRRVTKSDSKCFSRELCICYLPFITSVNASVNLREIDIDR